MLHHETTPTRRSYVYIAGIALWAATAASAQVAIDASGNYKQEVQSCRSGKTAQNLATCLEEARNARADKRLGNTSADELKANAMARCEKLPMDDKEACRARMTGQGTTSGSVAAGGILREYTTQEIVQPDP